MAIRALFYAIWMAWIVSWFAAALWTSPTAKRPALGSQAPYRIVTILGAVLLFGIGRPQGWIAQPFWLTSDGMGLVLAMVAAAGFVFCWWARIYLGRLWSGTITRKVDHHVVSTGPYRFVRHPIYTGIIVATFATALAEATPLAMLGAVIMTTGWYIKARAEELFLRSELGAEAYDAYARKTAMLIPFVRI